jgi:hypothetical protein
MSSAVRFIVKPWIASPSDIPVAELYWKGRYSLNTSVETAEESAISVYRLQLVPLVTLLRVWLAQMYSVLVTEIGVEYVDPGVQVLELVQ